MGIGQVGCGRIGGMPAELVRDLATFRAVARLECSDAMPTGDEVEPLLFEREAAVDA